MQNKLTFEDLNYIHNLIYNDLNKRQLCLYTNYEHMWRYELLKNIGDLREKAPVREVEKKKHKVTWEFDRKRAIELLNEWDDDCLEECTDQELIKKGQEHGLWGDIVK